MEDKRIYEQGSVSVCEYCVQTLLKSLVEGNIGTRCSIIDTQTTPNHRDNNTWTIELTNPFWKWSDKLKVSNDDRRYILRTAGKP